MSSGMHAAQKKYAGEDVFISHADLQKDCFAVHLRRALEAGGDATVFLDERSILLGQLSIQRMKYACCGASLVIFVMTRQFLRSQWCMDELRWTLQQRETNGGRLPVLYPGDVVRGYSRTELRAMPLDDRENVMDMLTAESIELNHLSPLSPDLESLIVQHSPLEQQPSREHHGHEQEQEQKARQPVSLEQRKKDLEELKRFCCLRVNACARYRFLSLCQLQL